MSEAEQRDAPVRAVVFDLFDTLVDLHFERMTPIDFRGAPLASTARALYDAFSSEVTGVGFDQFAEALQNLDRGFQKTRYREGLELPTGERFSALVERVGGDAALVERLVAVHMDALYEQVRVLEHHAEVLLDLRRHAVLALCSNFSHSETALRVLDAAGLREHLDVIAVSDVRGFRKPRPEIFQETLGGLGVSAAETLHVGDNLHADVAGAGPLGIRTVWLTRRVADPEEKLRRYEGPTPDYVLEDLAELPALVERLNAAQKP
jgi:HAD superfamily hydrolase (TIGR01509 family)